MKVQTVQKVQKFIKKHLYKIILTVFILFMITNPGNKLVKHLIKYKNTLLGKMISVIVILYVSSKNITYGILLGVIFMFSLFIYNKKRSEHFESENSDVQKLIGLITESKTFDDLKDKIGDEEEEPGMTQGEDDDDDDDEPGTTQGDDDDDEPGTTQGDDDDDDDNDNDDDDNDDDE
jgi:hypothetical protein